MVRVRFLPIALVLAGIAFGPGQAEPPSGPKPAPPPAHPIAVHHAWARPANAGGTAAIYLSIANIGDQADQLLAAETPVAEHSGLHAVTMQGDMVRMRDAPEVPIPAHGKVVFRPGAWHVMLMGLKQPLALRDRFPLVLVFKYAGRVETDVSVRADAPGSFWGDEGTEPGGNALWTTPDDSNASKGITSKSNSSSSKKKGLGGLL